MKQGVNDGNKLPLAAVLALGAIPRVALAFLPMKTLLQYVLPDDSYYYFQIATNLSRGLGPTIDGVNLTNGFHPLWAYAITPIFLLKGIDPDLPVRLCMLAGGALDVAAAYFIYRTVRLLSSSRGGALLGAACYLVAPLGVLHSVNGLETAPKLFFVALTTWQLARLLHLNSWRVKDLLALGAFCGLMNLARSDTVPYTLAILLLLTYFLLRQRKPLLLAGFVGPVAALAAPWLIWNAATFGTVVQVSAVAMPYVMKAKTAGSATLDLILGLGAVVRKFGGFTHFSPFSGLTLVAVGLAWGLLVRSNAGAKKDHWAVLAPTGAAFATFVADIAGRGFSRDWYFSEFAVVAALSIGVAAALYPVAAKRKGLLFLGVFLLWFVGGVPYAVNRAVLPSYEWQPEMRRGAEWINAHPGAKVGAFNAGIMSYYADNRVTGIDGNVNNAAFDALQRRRLYRYVVDHDIAYIVDYDRPVYHMYKKFWPPDKLPFIKLEAELDDPELDYTGATFGVYRVYRDR
jgi:hypothetical protein